jgi:hypothetical protein
MANAGAASVDSISARIDLHCASVTYCQRFTMHVLESRDVPLSRCPAEMVINLFLLRNPRFRFALLFEVIRCSGALFRSRAKLARLARAI